MSATAKAYRLLRAVLMTAADDRIIPRNPCRIRGAGDEKPDERPVLTVAQVFDLSDRMTDRRFRALVLLATFASLRWGEAIALTRDDIDLAARTVSVRRQYVELTGQLVVGPPKSQAGTRTVAIPASIIPALRDHLDSYVGSDGTALVFTGPRGGCCGEVTSAGARAGLWRRPVWGFPGCTFMICAIPATPWPPKPVSAWRI